MFTTKLSFKNHPFFKDFYDIKPHSLYMKFERKLYDTGIVNRGILDNHLKAMRINNKMKVTHLAMILNCSRPQYLRMERGKNRFKDEQLEVLASLYGEDVSIYKDMQDVDYLLKKIGYNGNPDRAKHILELASRAISTSSRIEESQYENPDNTNLIPNKIFQSKPFSKEIRRQKLDEMIKNLKLRLQLIYGKMAEIGKQLANMKEVPEVEKIPFRKQFCHLEDEQTSILKLIEKLKINKIATIF